MSMNLKKKEIKDKKKIFIQNQTYSNPSWPI